MATDIQLRNHILQKVRNFPIDQLKELNAFISTLEKTNGNKDKILSYAGAWGQIDDNLFDELTKDLMSRRQRSRSRADE
jgi:hypothetical protein